MSKYYRNESYDPRFGKTSPKSSIFRDVSARINNKEPKHMTTRTLREEYNWHPFIYAACSTSIITIVILLLFYK